MERPPFHWLSNLDFAMFATYPPAPRGVRKEYVMTSKAKPLGVTTLLLASAVLSSGVAQAVDCTAREAELVGLHKLCDHGDRKACVRFGMLLGEAKERHADWHRAHAEWWWWEH